MSAEQYEKLSRDLKISRMKGKRTSRTGIGLGNIYRRVHTMYKDGCVKIFSAEGRGTVVQMWIPQNQERGGGEACIGC